MHWHYFRHHPSGDVYAISVGDNGLFGDICGPLSQEERTVENLVADNWHYDEDDQSWMGSQDWRMVGPVNPECDCPTYINWGKPVTKADYDFRIEEG